MQFGRFWLLMVVGLGVCVPVVVWGQEEPTPVELSAEDEAALAEADQLNDQAMELYGTGRFEEAIELVQSALAICEKSLGPEHPRRGLTHQPC